MIRFCLALLCMLLALPAEAEIRPREVRPGVWLIEDHSLPIVTVKLAYPGAGAAYDAPGREGLATFAALLLDEGAGEMDALAFHSALEKQAIRFEAGVSEDMLSVSMQTLSEYKSSALGLLSLALEKPRMDAEAVERIRASILSELRQMEQNPDYLASLNWKQHAFPNHPYGQPRRGTLQSVAGITREALSAFAAERIACGSRHIAVVGDITPAEVTAWLDAGSHPACKDGAPAAIADVSARDGTATPVIIPVGVPQTVVMASLPAVKRDDPRYYAVTVLNHIMGGSSLTARLGREIRDKRGLAYYAESSVSTLDHAGYISVSFATRNAQAYEALKIFRAELGKIAKDGVSAAELAEAKSFLTGSFPLQLDNQSALAEYLLAMQHYRLGIDYLVKRNGFITAVTLEQVNAAAKDLLSHAPLIVMAGEPGEAKFHVQP